MYLWHQQRSATDMVRYGMARNASGIWQAVVIVTDTGGTSVANHGFYAFFASKDEINIGTEVFGDTTSIGTNVNLTFPVSNVSVKRTTVGTVAPLLKPFQIDYVPMDTVVYTFDEVNMVFSVKLY